VIRKFGIAFVAILATSALVASAAQAIVIKSSSYPQTVTGSGTEIGEHFEIPGAGSVKCHLSEYHGVLSEESSTLTVTPSYTEKTTINGEAGRQNCLFGPFNATVTNEGCNYVFHGTEHDAETATFTAHVDVVCAAGKVIKIVAGTCEMQVGSQNGLTTVDITNVAGSPSHISVRPTVSGISYNVTKDGFGCPLLGTGVRNDAKYTSTGYITVTAPGGLSVST
jgi:hypothetical protein